MRKSYVWAVLIAGGLSIWMASPLLVPLITGGASHGEGEAVAATTQKDEAAPVKLFRVRTKSFAAEPYRASVTAQGVTEASANVEVRARSNGTILAVNVKQGSEVKAGDVLCEIDIGSWKTDMLRAEAERVSADRDLKAIEKLAKQDFASEAQLLTQRARKDSADAAVAALNLEKEYKTVKAPSGGVLIEKPAEVGTLMQPGALCATVSTMDPVLVVAQIGERYVPYLTEGFEAGAKLATGEEVRGKVRFIAKASDAATRTFRVELEVPNPGIKIRQGVSAELKADLPPVPAHKLPGSALSLDDSGKFGVRVVNADNTTTFTPVTVVAQTVDGMWVTGLPPQANIVTVGQDYVRDGEKVEPIVDTADAAQ